MFIAPGSLADRLIDRLASYSRWNCSFDGLIYWLIDYLFDGFFDWLIDWYCHDWYYNRFSDLLFFAFFRPWNNIIPPVLRDWSSELNPLLLHRRRQRLHVGAGQFTFSHPPARRLFRDRRWRPGICVPVGRSLIWRKKSKRMASFFSNWLLKSHMTILLLF